MLRRRERAAARPLLDVGDARDELEALARRRAVGLAAVGDEAREQAQRRLVLKGAGVEVVGEDEVVDDRLAGPVRGPKDARRVGRQLQVEDEHRRQRGALERDGRARARQRHEARDVADARRRAEHVDGREAVERRRRRDLLARAEVVGAAHAERRRVGLVPAVGRFEGVDAGRAALFVVVVGAGVMCAWRVERQVEWCWLKGGISLAALAPPPTPTQPPSPPPAILTGNDAPAGGRGPRRAATAAASARPPASPGATMAGSVALPPPPPPPPLPAVVALSGRTTDRQLATRRAPMPPPPSPSVSISSPSSVSSPSSSYS